MKPEVIGEVDEHPLEFAVIDGLEPEVPLHLQPVIYGTSSLTDAAVLAWAREDPERLHLGMVAVTRLLMPNTTNAGLWVMRFGWCPTCNEWAPCHFRTTRGY